MLFIKKSIFIPEIFKFLLFSLFPFFPSAIAEIVGEEWRYIFKLMTLPALDKFNICVQWFSPT